MLNITQKESFNITLDQIQSIEEFKPVQVPQERINNQSQFLNENRLKHYQTHIGQSSQVANQSCPIIAFAISELTSTIKNDTVEKNVNHLIQAKKVLNNPDCKDVLTFSQMEDLDECSIITFSNSS